YRVFLFRLLNALDWKRFLKESGPIFFSKFSQLLVFASYFQALYSPMQKNPLIITEMIEFASGHNP
ncbi:MAG: hypothetical protein VXW29_17485, partial [SAR324 cluster bacterium]|nr:hypothetical protein [SAR324 cluster bacterium]